MYKYNTAYRNRGLLAVHIYLHWIWIDYEFPQQPQIVGIVVVGKSNKIILYNWVGWFDPAINQSLATDEKDKGWLAVRAFTPSDKMLRSDKHSADFGRYNPQYITVNVWYREFNTFEHAQQILNKWPAISTVSQSLIAWCILAFQMIKRYRLHWS